MAKKSPQKKGLNYLGWFIGAVVIQIIVFSIAMLGNDFSSSIPFSRFLVPVMIIGGLADVLCIYRIVKKTQKTWFDKAVLTLSYLPVLPLLYYILIIIILLIAVLGCVSHSGICNWG